MVQDISRNLESGGLNGGDNETIRIEEKMEFQRRLIADMLHTSEPTCDSQNSWTRQYLLTVSDILNNPKRNDNKEIRQLVIQGEFDAAVKRTEALLEDLKARGPLPIFD